VSQQNAEYLRAALETWGQEPWTLEAWQQGGVIDMQLFDPEVVYEDTVLPDHVGEAYRGHQGVVRAAERWIEGSEWLLLELQQIIGDGDRLVSIHRARSKARYSGIEFDMPLAYVWTFRNGKVVHFQSFIDPQQAIASADLEG
jgi:ketosteroid isomerase-like protein